MAEVITSGKVIQKPEIVLEPTDFLPPGIQGVRTKTRDEMGPFNAGADSSADELLVNPFPEEDEIDFEDTPPASGGDLGQLPVPNDMKIISQTLRVGPDGKITVDVVIETSDFPGIEEFEAKLTKDMVLVVEE